MSADHPAAMTNSWHAKYGAPWPLGVQWIAQEHAYNFAIYSKNATRIELLLFGESEFDQPVVKVELAPRFHKSGPVWHARLQAEQMAATKYYAYRIEGPPPTQGYDLHQFDSQKLLLDPYAKDIYFPPNFCRQAAILPGDNIGRAPLGILPGIETQFDWGDDVRVRHGADLIIYELHVRGFTQSETSGLSRSRRGTFLGVVDKIPYLKRLGVTAVELMPVFQFDPQEGNYWGYMPLNFFAPHEAYASASAEEDQHSEFREMVKQLHLAGIEVILDVVYNHTSEGDENGPIYSFKGIEATSYYIMSGDVNHPFSNYSGTGNTLHTANRATRQLVVDSLRYWVNEMHVDGFRFDLASIFMRGKDGEICADEPPIFGQIAGDPDLAGIRLIAEPWDAGAYELGRGFPGTQWMQWNSAFQSCVQRFVRGDEGQIPELMTRLHGSQDIFPDDCFHALRPFQSVNYINSHDGFTLYDLVSYNQRHNAANGHGNQDGQREQSWNCGVEGDGEVSEAILELRIRQAKNLFTLLMLSAGTPMFRMGDEFLQTQGGNNNPYNQDNETSWLDWDRADEFEVFREFCSSMIAFRKSHPSLCRTTFWHDSVHWYGAEHTPDLSLGSRCISFCLHGDSEETSDLYVMINGASTTKRFGVFERKPDEWRCVVDTSRPCEQTVASLSVAPPITESYLSLDPRTVVVLEATATRQ